MDIQTIDSNYNQLKSQAQQTVAELKELAVKLQAAVQAGDPNAREWFLDLKSIALAIQAEQNQVTNLLQSLHNFVEAQQPPLQQASFQQPQVQQLAPQSSPWGNQPPAYPQAPGGYPPPNNMGGLLGGLLNSGFGRAIVTGAGFGIGDDLINKIF
jgi:hypothetical protein